MSINMLDNRYLTFFHNKDGTANLMSSWLECHQLPYYFTLLKNHPHAEPFEYFLDHIWFTISFTSDSLADIELHSRKPHGAFHAESFTASGMQGMHGIESLLDEGYIVPFQTFEQRVPFYHAFRSFTEPFAEQYSGTPHTFIAIGHTHNELFYTEAPWGIRESGHVIMQGNKSVGIITKSDLRHSFDCFVTYSKIRLDDDAHPHIDCWAYVEAYVRETATLEAKLSKSKSNASKNASRLFHVDGLRHLCEQMERDSLFLGTPSHLQPEITNSEFLIWKFNLLKNRRAVLEQVLLKHYSSWPKNKVERTVHHLQQNLTLWESFLRVMKKMTMNGNYTFKTSVCDYLQPIIESESFLADAVRNLQQKANRRN